MHPDITLNATSHGLPPAGHYSASVTAGGFVFISGQLPITRNGEKKAGASFEEQTRHVLENVDACLKGAGVSRQHLVSVRVYVTDINQWPTFNEIYAEWIGDFRPSRVVAGVAELHYGSALEVEAIALAQ
ncbi:RidA family protein [Citrobacter amalonaticus]|uniref:RidA family protein n=1 Tax=Citrobacter amalonaticus TaxID=35703 RepID=A0A8I0SZ22_CITAM|nr:RidA family protein [Citrobacter amalonaticus]AMG94926.1 RidA family protein [Citrobacter amalonaticus]MBE0130287.1 RidA family protein [Citrobacter amalonaticus]MCP1628366.1 reactive intermediate/imine deaminase [Citrobacter amalonaticus]HAU5634719.1 RidA family protein [Citrobacter amalonaticus]HDQ2810173.1 RidA family protein [Citrobacter amalonaticus]